MARPPSDRKPFSVYLTPAEAEEADRQATALGLLNEKGLPSRSALFRKLLEENRVRMERKQKREDS